MSIKVLEEYISPWVLPNEHIVGRMRWEHSNDLQMISIKFPPKMEMWLPNVNVYKKSKNKFVFEVKQLEAEDRLTFVSLLNRIPKKMESSKTFTIHFMAKNKKILATETLRTTLIRPLLAIKEISPREIELTEEKIRAIIKIVLQAQGWADILKVKPTMKIDVAYLEAGVIKPRLVAETNPFLDLNVEEYLDRIVVKRAGKTSFTIAFSYEDRIGNKYETNSAEVRFVIHQIKGIQSEIPIENKVLFGEKERVISRIGRA